MLQQVCIIPLDIVLVFRRPKISSFGIILHSNKYMLYLELQRDGAIYYLIFCRSIWHYPLRMDNTLYTEVVFNQIAPDYLEGLLLIMPGEQIDQNFVYDIAKVSFYIFLANLAYRRFFLNALNYNVYVFGTDCGFVA